VKDFLIPALVLAVVGFGMYQAISYFCAADEAARIQRDSRLYRITVLRTGQVYEGDHLFRWSDGHLTFITRQGVSMAVTGENTIEALPPDAEAKP
jgi:hypothetical protein